MLSMGFMLINLFLLVAILVVIGIVIALIVRGVLKRSKTGISSAASAYVTVISRRTEEAGGGKAKYFATFEMESGQRIELELISKDYDALAESQKGKLTYRGTRFNSFERTEA